MARRRFRIRLLSHIITITGATFALTLEMSYVPERFDVSGTVISRSKASITASPGPVPDTETDRPAPIWCGFVVR